MIWEILAAGTPATALLGVAIWRFSRLEAAVKHQHRCQVSLVRAISRLNVRVRKLTDDFKEHAAKEDNRAQKGE